MKRLAALAVAVALGATGLGSAKAQDYPAMRLKYASHVPGNNVVSEVDKFFAEELKKRSGGKLVVDFYWNRALGKVSEMLPLIAAGAVDFTTLEPPQYSETQLAAFLATPMAFYDAKQVVGLGEYLYTEKTPVRAELERVGARNIWTRHLPNYKLLCRKPYRTMADFKGAKLRSFGAYVPIMWQAMGANAVNVIASELYEGLSKGTFDCAFLPPAFHVDYKLYEPAKYLIDFDFGMIVFGPMLVPTVVWDRWPESVRKLVTEISKDTQEFSIKHIEENSDQAIALMLRNGAQLVKFEEPDALRKAVPNMIDAWLQKQKDAGRGAEAAEIVDIARGRFRTN
jgi:TRAP-type C4-dicarboxylate transport system substrate-binding protein